MAFGPGCVSARSAVPRASRTTFIRRTCIPAAGCARFPSRQLVASVVRRPGGLPVDDARRPAPRTRYNLRVGVGLGSALGSPLHRRDGRANARRGTFPGRSLPLLLLLLTL